MANNRGMAATSPILKIPSDSMSPVEANVTSSLSSQRISEELESEAKNASFVGRQFRHIDPKTTFDPENEQIKSDILLMIVRYLQEHGYSASAAVIMDEADVKVHEQHSRRSQILRARRHVMEGDWDTVAKLALKHLPRRSHKSFLYTLYKQEYLEMIERQEFQRAFTYLGKRLKPLQPYSQQHRSSQEFTDLCYLLTCTSVREAESFKHWEGVMGSREKLASLFESSAVIETTSASEGQNIPPGRLEALLQQATAYQMEFSRYHPRVVPKVTTLARDFECFILPNVVRDTFVGHTSNVKCVEFVGEDGP